MNRLLAFLIASLILTLSSCVAYVSEDNLFNPSRATIEVADSVSNSGTIKHNIELQVAPNTVLRGYHIQSTLDQSAHSSRTILYDSGNGGMLSQSRVLLDSLSIVFNAQVYAFDWRGYGFSDGTPSLRLITSDALKVYDLVDSLTQRPPIVMGRSMGSGVTVFVAANRRPDAAILISPLADINTVIEGWGSFNPWYERPFVRVRPDSALAQFHPQPKEIASLISCPVLILHGEQDRLIPISSGRELFDSLTNSPTKKFIALPDRTHYNISLTSPPVSNAILTFLDTIKH